MNGNVDKLMVKSIVNNILLFECSRRSRFMIDTQYAVSQLAKHINSMMQINYPLYKETIIGRERLEFAVNVAHCVISTPENSNVRMCNIYAFLCNKLRNKYTVKSLLIQLIEYLIINDTILFEYIANCNGLVKMLDINIPAVSEITSSQLNIQNFEEGLWDLHNDIIKLYEKHNAYARSIYDMKQTKQTVNT